MVDRAGVLRVLQHSLADLHEHRRLVTGTPAEAGVVHLIKYWDAVLGWLKEQQGSDVIVMSRTK